MTTSNVFLVDSFGSLGARGSHFTLIAGTFQNFRHGLRMVFVIVDDENRNRNIGNAVGLEYLGRGHVSDDTKLPALEGGGIGGLEGKK